MDWAQASKEREKLLNFEEDLFIIREELRKNRFYGEWREVWVDGVIVRIEKVESFKPKDFFRI